LRRLASYSDLFRHAEATLGLLFVNIRRRGIDPVWVSSGCDRRQRWNWDLVYMLTHFGWKAVIGIILSNLLYLTVSRREFARLAANIPDEEQEQEGRRPIPWRITGIHILFKRQLKEPSFSQIEPFDEPGSSGQIKIISVR
jgi:hypothetical protein